MMMQACRRSSYFFIAFAPELSFSRRKRRMETTFCSAQHFLGGAQFSGCTHAGTRRAPVFRRRGSIATGHNADARTPNRVPIHLAVDHPVLGLQAET